MNTKTSVSVPLVQAIENAWAAIQELNPNVPDVVVTLGSGAVARGMKLGHFAPSAWTRGEGTEDVHELFVGAEGLLRGAQALMGTLLHEAVHAMCEAQGIKDTSRNGRYHNKKFLEAAKTIGIEVEHSADLGWSTTTMPDATAKVYETAILDLDASITAHRYGFEGYMTGGAGTGTTGTLPTLPKLPKAGGRKSSNNGLSVSCGCGRKIRVSQTVLDMGGIVCSVCGDEFD